MTHYSIIYADPPWHYNKGRRKGHSFGMGAHGHYSTMADEDIYRLPIQSISQENAALFLWTTFPRLIQGITTISKWGFTYKTLAFTWIKTTPLAPDDMFTRRNFSFGVGYYTKSNAEVCLLGIRGKMRPISNSISSLIIARRSRHSEKPAEARKRIVDLFGDVTRVELFARPGQEHQHGWDLLGYEIDGMDIKDSIHEKISENT